MATIALFCLSRSLAHAARTLMAAPTLSARGHRCVLHGAPGWLASLVDDHEAVVILDEPPLDTVLAASRGKRAPGDAGVRLQLAIAADRAALRDCGADIAVVDNRRSAGLAAEASGLPWVSITSGLMLGPHCAVAPAAAAFARVVSPVMGVPAEFMRRTGRLQQLADTDPVSPQAQPLPDGLARTVAQVGARPRRFVHDLSLGDRTLVLDHPALLPTRNLPETAVQPGAWRPREGKPPSLPPTRAPRVWLTAGATGDPTLLPRLARGLRRWGLDVVVSSSDPTTLPGCHVLPLTDLDTLLPSIDLVVCHGGAGTVHHALAHGCRVLALPTHLEQAMVGLALEARGLGAVMPAITARLEPVAAVGLATALLRGPAPSPLHCPRAPVEDALCQAIDDLI